MNATARVDFFCDTISACESGWDFSSRWLKDPSNLSTIQTRKIVPVDLNAIMYKVESNLEYFHSIVDRLSAPTTDSPVNYTKQRLARQEAMEALLWDEETSQWYDYNLELEMRALNVRSIANFFPLWSGAHRPLSAERKRAIFNAVLKSFDQL